MLKVNFGDQECKRCEDEYFKENAIEEMKEHNLCFNCIAEHRRKFSDMSLKEFSNTERKCSHYKI